MKVAKIAIHNNTDCPVAEDMIRFALMCISDEELEKVGDDLTAFYWDLDNLEISRNPSVTGEGWDDADYSIRTWDVRQTRKGKLRIELTLYRMVYEGGSGYGEPLCNGMYSN